jgi:hypothetical protein
MVVSAAPAHAQRNEQDSSGAKQGKPDVVHVGALVNDIQQLELSTHSYNIDMYMWFRWSDKDRDPANTCKFNAKRPLGEYPFDGRTCWWSWRTRAPTPATPSWSSTWR